MSDRVVKIMVGSVGRGDKVRTHSGGFVPIKRAVHLSGTSRLFFEDGGETVYSSADLVDAVLNVFGSRSEDRDQ